MVANSDNRQDKSKPNTCPICNEPTRPDNPAFPFCGERCRQIDLGKWLDGKYLISRPVEQSDLDEGE